MLENPAFISWLRSAYGDEVALETEALPEDLQSELYESIYYYGPAGERVQAFMDDFIARWNATPQGSVFISEDFMHLVHSLGAKAITSSFQRFILNSPNLDPTTLWVNESLVGLTFELDFPTRVNMCLWAVCWGIAGEQILTGKIRAWWEHEILPSASELLRLMTGKSLIDRPLSYSEWTELYLESVNYSPLKA